jgi:hypothetical protein
MAAATSRKKTQMSNEHLQALAKGRTEGASIRRYLNALQDHKPRRGRKRTPDSMQRRMTAIEKQLETADALTRLNLIQERIDLEHQLEHSQDAVDMKALEDEFVKTAKVYGERKGISYAAWREAGVDAAVLRRANIKRAAT